MKCNCSYAMWVLKTKTAVEKKMMKLNVCKLWFKP